uniref:Non-structural ORFs n=1 Tax=Ambidensovirus sp. TaxID=2050976 RepID=A0A2Z4EVF9_9VIRU|nr:Non-structural ORFs [Ambidensovirus sp.]
MSSSNDGTTPNDHRDWCRSPEGFGRLYGAPSPAAYEDAEVDEASNHGHQTKRRRLDMDTADDWLLANGLRIGSCIRCELERGFDEDVSGFTVCHEVLFPGNPDVYPAGRDRCLEILRSTTWTTGQRKTFAVALHDLEGTHRLDRSHIHVVHRCETYRRRQTCECSGFRSFKPVGFTIKRVYHTATKGRGRAILLYLSQRGRHVEQIGIASYAKDWELHLGNVPEPCECRQDNSLDAESETAYFRGIDRHCSPFRTGEEDRDTPKATRSSGEIHRERGNKLVELGKKASKTILTWFPEDETSLRKMVNFKETFEELYWDANLAHQVLGVAFEDATKEWLNKPLAEMAQIRWDNANQFLHNHHDPYFSPLFSAQIMTRLLLNQFDDNIDNAKEFLTNLVAVIDKTIPKKNTFVIIGAPSAGKTYFMRSLFKLAWKYGLIRNNKKGGDSFTYQDAIGCRIVEWNECLLMGQEEVETAKLVWEGATAAVNVKYKSNQRLLRTPLIVTTNSSPWRLLHHNVDKKAFQDRCFLYHWKAQPWLKDLTMYPCPLSWKILLENMQSNEWYLTCPTEGELLAANTNNTDPNIYFDMWVTKTWETDPSPETNDLYKNCILYNRFN